MLHLDEGTIHGWLDGELSDAERARVERHVAECHQCAAAVAEARGMIAGAARIVSALDSVPGGVIPLAPPVARRSRSLWRTLGVTPARAAFAATLLIAVAATLAKRHDRTSAFPVEQPARTVNSTATSVAPSPTAPSGVAQAVGGLPAKAAFGPRVMRERPTITRVPAAAAPVAAEAKRREAQPAAANAGATDTTTNRNSGVVGGMASGVAGGVARSTSPRYVAANQLQEVVATSSLAQTGFPGCYRVTSDSLIRAGFPQRFALQVATSEQRTAHNVVRLVAPDGRIDGVLAGGTWRELSPRVANVSFAVTAGRTLRLELTESGAMAAPADEARQVGAIVRDTCRP